MSINKKKKYQVVESDLSSDECEEIKKKVRKYMKKYQPKGIKYNYY